MYWAAKVKRRRSSGLVSFDKCTFQYLVYILLESTSSPHIVKSSVLSISASPVLLLGLDNTLLSAMDDEVEVSIRGMRPCYERIPLAKSHSYAV